MAEQVMSEAEVRQLWLEQEARRMEQRKSNLTVPHLGDATYQSLKAVLEEAFDQAAHGKGARRHAQGAKWEDQPMARLAHLDFCSGQAAKKILEAFHLAPDEAIHELLGAINYLAGRIQHLRRIAPAAGLADEGARAARRAVYGDPPVDGPILRSGAARLGD